MVQPPYLPEEVIIEPPAPEEPFHDDLAGPVYYETPEEEKQPLPEEEDDRDKFIY